MKKTFFLIMLAMMMATGAMAQKMVVKTTDKQTVMYDIPNVECVAFIDGYVDLGLPSGTLWATMNVGASSPEEYGDLFAWGETEPKSEYAWNNCFDTEDNGSTFKTYYNNGGLTELLSEDDAASVNWGEGWQTPSMEQFQELIDPNYTTTVWTEQKGIHGRMIIGKNSQYIFLPAAGFCWGPSPSGIGSFGTYWTSSLTTNSSSDAYFMWLDSGSLSSLYSARAQGRSIRPVVCGAKQIQIISVTGIVLNYSTLSLQPDGTKQLTATFEPEGASNKAVKWTSSDATVATVSTDGLVTAVAEGTCTITCSAKDGSGVKAECQVTVVLSCPDDNHPHTIDLGLPSGTKWACCNVGASTPEEIGYITPWGETIKKSLEYSIANYKYRNIDTRKLTKYCTHSKYGHNGFTDGLTELLPEDDAATFHWGDQWRTPSAEQIEELVNNCSYEWGEQDEGLLLTGPNGAQMFLPAGGVCDDIVPAGRDKGEAGYYWSSSLDTDDNYNARILYFRKPNDDHPITFSLKLNPRYDGLPVRAVRK